MRIVKKGGKITLSQAAWAFRCACCKATLVATRGDYYHKEESTSSRLFHARPTPVCTCAACGKELYLDLGELPHKSDWKPPRIKNSARSK